MKPDKQIQLQSIYTIFVEEPDDFYFHPRGVLFVDAEQNHTSPRQYSFLEKALQDGSVHSHFAP